MPELPEVEAARRLLDRGCVGKRIEKVVAANDDKVFEGVSPEEVRRALEGRRVVHAHRKGKYLWLELDNPEGPWPLLHFGMTGGIVVQKLGVTKYKRIHLESDPDEWPPRFTKLDLDLEGGGKLAFVDSRRFARVKLLVDPPSQEPLCRLGFDVFDELPPLEQFAAALRQRVARAPTLRIKALLLDQDFCSGIGNWVGDEVLYQARIHPEQAAASLDDSALAALHAAIRSVVDLAVEAEADSERFPRDWLFHYRWTNKKASAVNGHKIEFVTVGSRTSAFVPALQKLTGGGGGSGGGAKTGGSARKRGGGSIKKAESEEDDEEDEEEEAGDSDEEGNGANKRRKKTEGKPAAAATRKPRGAQARAKKPKEESEDEEDEEEREVSEEEVEEEDSSDDGKAGKKRSRAKKPAAKKAAPKAAGAAAKKPAAPRRRKARA